MIKKALYITAIVSMASCGTPKNNAMETTSDSNFDNKTTSNISTTETKDTFWGEMLAEACRQSTDENICLSPLSAQLAMAMVANGAKGRTKEEIYDAMQLGNDANRHCRELLDNLETEFCEVKIANSIWINEKLDVKQEFVETNKKYFDALVERATFDDSTVERVNDWCNENTNGKIPTIIERLSNSDRMLLINALYFKAAWSKPFREENTTNQPFTTESGEKIEVPTMMMRTNASYYKDDVLAMTTKSLQDGYSMLLVLPNEGVGCDEAAEYLAKDFNSYLKSMEVCDLTLSLPKFTTDFGRSLKPILEELGIKRAFNSKAQFGGISDEALYISDVVQKTYINVNEMGTEAAAVTAVQVGLLSMRAQKIELLTLDRPFIYAIINYDNEVLFTGKVGNPAIK